MAIDLNAMNTNGSVPSDLTITEIDDKESLKDWSKVASEGFSFPMHAEPALFLWTIQFMELQAPVKFYLAKLDNIPVASSMSVFAEGVAGL